MAIPSSLFFFGPLTMGGSVKLQKPQPRRLLRVPGFRPTILLGRRLPQARVGPRDVDRHAASGYRQNWPQRVPRPQS